MLDIVKHRKIQKRTVKKRNETCFVEWLKKIFYKVVHKPTVYNNKNIILSHYT